MKRLQYLVRLSVFILGAAIAMGPHIADAQTDRTVAVVDGQRIHMSDLEAIRKTHPQAQHMPMDDVYDQLVDMAIEMALLDAQAKAANLQDDPQVIKQLATVQANLMRRAYLQKRRDEALTQELLQKRYASLLAKSPPQEELKVRQILTETEAQAKVVIAELLSGADFVELAGRVSIGRSAKEGGLIGFVARQDVPTTFSEAAFVLPVGQYTKKPVKTSLGWHVIRVEEKRIINPPAFDDIKDELVRDETAKIATKVIRELRNKASVVRYEPDGRIVR